MKPGRSRAKHIFDMFVTDVTDLAVSNPEAATAIAISDLVGVASALVFVIAALVFAGFLIGLLQVGVIWHGINKMTEASEKRDKRHETALKAEAKRHQEAMDAQKAARAAEADRHQEAMDALAAERKNSQHRHEQAMKALNALIRNSGRRNRPVHAR